MNPDNSPLLDHIPQEAKEFLIALSPQKPIIIKRNAQHFLDEFHKSAAKTLENMKLKYIKELKTKQFEGKLEERLYEFNMKLREVDKLINEKIDVVLGIEIMNIAINWVHPFFFKLSNGDMSNLYKEAFELTRKGMEILVLGYFKTENFEKCVKYANIYIRMKPKDCDVNILRILYSAYVKCGDIELAHRTLTFAKNILSISDFNKIVEASPSIQIKPSRKYRFKIFFLKHTYSLANFLLTGIITYVFTKYLLKFPVKESFVYSLGASFITFVTSFCFFKKTKLEKLD